MNYLLHPKVSLGMPLGLTTWRILIGSFFFNLDLLIIDPRNTLGTKKVV